MTRGPQEPSVSGPGQDNLAPWGTKRRMRTMAVVGPILGAILLILGIIEIIAGHSRGIAMVIIASIVLAVFMICTPIARKNGKI